MSGHMGESLVRDGSQGTHAQRARRERDLLNPADPMALLNAAELVEARRLAREATVPFIKELIRQSTEAAKDKDRQTAGKLVMAVAWGLQLFTAQKPAASLPAGGSGGSVTVNILGRQGDLPQQVQIVDVGARSKPELEARTSE